MEGEVTKGYRSYRKNVHIPTGCCNRSDGIVNDPCQMCRTVTTVVIMVLIAVGVMIYIADHQIECCRIMPRHCLGMVVPRKGQPRTEVNQQQQTEQ